MVAQTINQLLEGLTALRPYAELLIIIILFLVISRFILIYVRRKLIKGAKTKKQISDIKIFSRIFNIIAFFIIVFVVFFSYIKSWSGLGIFAGLITAGLGFALQRPITGLAAWIMVVVKRPFVIGDRIMIGTTKGEVYDITLSHVYINETGGAIETEEFSGKNILIPNYKLFENDIINYTLMHDNVLGELNVLVTYEGDLEKAIKIIEDVAIKHTKKYNDEVKGKVKIRTSFKDSGINIRALFYSPIQAINGIKTEMTREIYKRISKEKNIDFAYPHTEVILRKK
jgi:small-conductance mechanosensitive channel